MLIKTENGKWLNFDNIVLIYWEDETMKEKIDRRTGNEERKKQEDNLKAQGYTETDVKQPFSCFTKEVQILKCLTVIHSDHILVTIDRDSQQKSIIEAIISIALGKNLSRLNLSDEFKSWQKDVAEDGKRYAKEGVGEASKVTL